MEGCMYLRLSHGFFWLTLFFVFPVFSAQAVRGPQNVSLTVHNLSSNQGGVFDPYYSDNEDEVCIFCHTPHGGSLNGPLWNRSLPEQSGNPFTHYNSATLSDKIAGVNRPVSDESLLCLSCHDGSLAINQVINPSNDTGQPTIGGNAFQTVVYVVGQVMGFIGKSPQNDTETTHRDLTDDHPISFSYTDVQTSEEGKLHTVLDAAAAGVRFFGSTARVECSSCHDPHVNYDSLIPEDDPLADERYRPFLITPNTGSALCLACHDK